MIDINILRKNPDLVRETVRKRRSNVDVERLIYVDTEFRSLSNEIEGLRHQQKQIKFPEEIEKARVLKNEIQQKKTMTETLEKERTSILEIVPNFIAPDNPEGEDDSGNVEIYRWGQKPEFDFEPKCHDILAKELDMLDIARGTKIAGTGFCYWKGDGARLTRALFNLAQDFIQQKGFTPMIVPLMAKDISLYGTGYLPFFPEEIYRVSKNDLCLIGTSEQVLVGYHYDEILSEKDLPMCYSAFTPCFRTEAGAHGKESRGAFRMHQFQKLEQIVFCQPEESEAWHLECQKNAQEFMELLEIPYRVVRSCLGDMAAPAYKKYDIEGWFASFEAFRETHSNSNLTDYQTRRMNIRYKVGKEMVYPHTLSATLIPDRAVLAIIENNQQEDGSIAIPKSIRPYMGGQVLIQKRT